MKKETTRLKCFGCHADFTVSAEEVHDTVRNASIPGMRKLRCPLCGSFLYPKEFEPTGACITPASEAFRFSACPMAEYCYLNDNHPTPECEEGRVSTRCMRMIFQNFDHVDRLFFQLFHDADR